MSKNLLFSMLCFSLLFFTQCATDDDPVTASGMANFKLTDAPIDDANVKGAFVTIADVKVDGESFSGFQGTTTVDVLALQNGRTEALGLGSLETGTYSNISLVLQYDVDANGNAPGCYILSESDEKIDLAASSASESEVVITNGAFEITENATTNVVLDFDLRKAIKYDDNNQSDFSLVSNAELQSSFRFVNESETGTVQGECNDPVVNSDKIVVYAYQKGNFNQDAEIQGEAHAQFSNSVTSASVDASGNYQLSFLEDGEYELVFVSYKKMDNNDSYELEGFLEVNSLLGIDLSVLGIEANANVTANVLVTGIVKI